MTQPTETRFQPGDTITYGSSTVHRYTVLVAEQDPEGDIVVTNSEGYYIFLNESRCKAVRDPLPSGFMNLYDDGNTGSLYLTRASADSVAPGDDWGRVAVIHIDETGSISLEDVR